METRIPTRASLSDLYDEDTTATMNCNNSTNLAGGVEEGDNFRISISLLKRCSWTK